MPTIHLNLVALEQFASSELDTQEMAAAAKHLSSCSSCRLRLRREVLEGSEVLHRLACRAWPGEGENDYDAAFEHLLDTVSSQAQRVQDERTAAPALVEELLALPFAEQRQRIADAPRYCTAAVADLLLELCAIASLEDPDTAEKLARLGLDIADGIEAGSVARFVANDLRARAWASLGNLQRLRSDFRTAEGAFVAAEAFLEEGSGDPLERARVLDLKASLLKSQRRLGPALALIDQVISIYRGVREHHRQGRAIISKALMYGLAEEQEKAVGLYFEALELLDLDKEPRLAMVALNNLVVDLAELDRHSEARALLPEVHRLLAVAGTALDRTRVLWAEGQLDLAEGDLEGAEPKLREVRDAFIAEGRGYWAAFASLDLAKIFLLRGRSAESLELASTMHVIFTSKEIHREALVALMFFQQAVEQERATVQLVDQVTTYLRKALHEPTLRFDRPA